MKMAIYKSNGYPFVGRINRHGVVKLLIKVGRNRRQKLIEVDESEVMIVEK